jgi:hypothetical protein
MLSTGTSKQFLSIELVSFIKEATYRKVGCDPLFQQISFRVQKI